MRVRVDQPGQQDLAAAVDGLAGWKAAAMAAGVSTPTMSAPSMATAPGARIRRLPSSVTTVALVMTSATGRFAGAPAPGDGGGRRATAARARRRSRQDAGDGMLDRPARASYVILCPVALHVVDHPIAHDLLLSLRDKTTPSDTFRQLAHRLSLVLTLEATRDLATRTTPSRRRSARPTAPGSRPRWSSCRCCGPGSACWTRCSSCCRGQGRPHRPAARRRDRGRVEVLRQVPGRPGQRARADDRPDAGHRRQRRVRARPAARRRRHATSGCCASSPRRRASKTVEAAYPGVHIYTPVVDAYLNAKKFIVPGLGDFGDRLYGT